MSRQAVTTNKCETYTRLYPSKNYRKKFLLHNHKLRDRVPSFPVNYRLPRCKNCLDSVEFC